MDESIHPEPVTAISVSRLLSPLELIKKAWDGYVGNFRHWVIIMLPAAVLSVLGPLMFPEMQGGMKTFPSVTEAVSLGFYMLLVIVVQFITTLALMVAVLRRITDVPNVYRAALKLLLPYIWISALVSLAIMGGLLLLIIPGLVFAVWFSLAPYLLVDRGTRGVAALRESRSIIRGHFWGFVGRILVLVALAIFASVIVGFLPKVLSAGVSVIVFVPFATLYMLGIYEGLKSLKSASI